MDQTYRRTSKRVAREPESHLRDETWGDHYDRLEKIAMREEEVKYRLVEIFGKRTPRRIREMGILDLVLRLTDGDMRSHNEKAKIMVIHAFELHKPKGWREDSFPKLLRRLERSMRMNYEERRYGQGNQHLHGPLSHHLTIQDVLRDILGSLAWSCRPYGYSAPRNFGF